MAQKNLSTGVISLKFSTDSIGTPPAWLNGWQFRVVIKEEFYDLDF